MQVVVIGAGVVGATIAARLAQRGAAVTLVDRSTPGSGTSSTSYAWINANGKEPQAYYDFNLAGLEAHHRLSPDRGGWLGTGGNVEIAVDDYHRDDLAARLRRHSARDYGAEEISVERARELLPDVRVPEAAQLIVHFTREAYAYPLIYLGHVLGDARLAGVTIRTGSPVTALRPSASSGGEVVLGDGTVLAADTVVSAVGRWTAGLAELAGTRVPVREFMTPGDAVVGYLTVTNPLPVRLTRLVTSPWLNARPAGGGRLLLQALDLDATADPRDVPDADSPLAATFVNRLQHLVVGTEGARIEQVIVGQRAMPDDGRTVVGRAPDVPWLYVVATHSGVTLAPYLGEAIAAEIYGEEQKAFAEFRVERFYTDTGFGQPYAPRRPGQQ